MNEDDDQSQIPEDDGAWLESLPEELTVDDVKAMPIRKVIVLEGAADNLTPGQRAGLEAFQSDWSKKFAASSAFKRLIDAQDRHSAMVRKMLKTTGPAIDVGKVRVTPELSTFLKTAESTQNMADILATPATDYIVEQSRQERAERELELEQGEAVVETLKHIFGVMADQDAATKHSMALNRTTVAYTFLALLAAVVFGVWAVTQEWIWTLVSGVAGVGVSGVIAWVLGVFTKSGDQPGQDIP